MYLPVSYTLRPVGWTKIIKGNGLIKQKNIFMRQLIQFIS